MRNRSLRPTAFSRSSSGSDQGTRSPDGAEAKSGALFPDVASAPSGLHTAADLLDDTFSDCKRRSDRSKDVARDVYPIALQLAHHFQDRFPVGALVDLTADVLWHFHGHSDQWPCCCLSSQRRAHRARKTIMRPQDAPAEAQSSRASKSSVRSTGRRLFIDFSWAADQRRLSEACPGAELESESCPPMTGRITPARKHTATTAGIHMRTCPKMRPGHFDWFMRAAQSRIM